MVVDIQVIIKAAEAGGKIIKKYFGEALDIEEKTTISDFRTKADTESENAILQIIQKEFSNFNILSEETGFIDNKSEYTFIIDPLDGSNNFVLGIPNFSVSIGLLKGDKAILGVIYLPMLNHTYYAEDRRGAFLDGVKLFVNKEADIKRSAISYACGYLIDRKYGASLKEKLNELGIKRLLDNWSPAADYCLVASGKFEAVINNNNEIYDYIAGKVIAREAGAKITDFSGEEEKNDREGQFLLSNGTSIHDQLSRIL